MVVVQITLIFLLCQVVRASLLEVVSLVLVRLAVGGQPLSIVATARTHEA